MPSHLTLDVRLCPSGQPTFDVRLPFLRVPMRGESIIHDEGRYVVVDIDWEDGEPFIVAHSHDRPRAQAALSWGAA